MIVSKRDVEDKPVFFYRQIVSCTAHALELVCFLVLLAYVYGIASYMFFKLIIVQVSEDYCGNYVYSILKAFVYVFYMIISRSLA